MNLKKHEAKLEDRSAEDLAIRKSYSKNNACTGLVFGAGSRFNSMNFLLFGDFHPPGFPIRTCASGGAGPFFWI